MKKMILIFLLLPYLTSAQTVGTIATGTGINDGLALDGIGNLFGSAYDGNTVYKVALSDGSVSSHLGGLNAPNGSVVGSDGHLFLADDAGGRIYKISPEGDAEVFVEYPNPSGLAFLPGTDTLVVTSYFGEKVSKIAPDGNITDWSSGGLFNGLVGICFDDEGQLYVGNFNDRIIIRILPDGTQDSLAQGPTNTFLGFIAFSGGHIYGTLVNGHKIFRTDLDGNLEMFLGSSGGYMDGGPDVAQFNRPNGIVASPYGDTLYVSEVSGQKIRIITDLEGVLSNSSEALVSPEVDFSPNPFNSTGKLSLELTAPENISIELRDMEGRFIRHILEKENLPAGEHEVLISGGELIPGIYHAVIRTERGAVLTKKIYRAK